MDQFEAREHTQSQMIGIFLIVFGTATVFVGCYFKFEAVTAGGGGITGAGINQITNLRGTQNNRSGPTVNLDAAKPLGG